MSGLVGINRHVAAIAADEFIPMETAWCLLDGGSIVLGAPKNDLAERVIRDRMELGRPDVAVDRDPGARCRRWRRVWVDQPGDAAVVALQDVAVGIEDHGPGV